jgi:hypothetical protein
MQRAQGNPKDSQATALNQHKEKVKFCPVLLNVCARLYRDRLLEE